MPDLPTYSPRRPVAQRQPRERDPAYLRSFKDTACEACGVQDGTVVGAHYKVGWFGYGYKSHDWMVIGLCAKCHRDQEANPGAEWWMRVLLRWRKLLYQAQVMAR